MVGGRGGEERAKVGMGGRHRMVCLHVASDYFRTMGYKLLVYIR